MHEMLMHRGRHVAPVELRVDGRRHGRRREAVPVVCAEVGHDHDPCTDV